MCIQSYQASQRYYYFYVDNGDTPVLSFASRVPDVFPRNGKFGQFNLRRVTYSLEAGDAGEKDLVAAARIRSRWTWTMTSKRIRSFWRTT